MIAEHGLERHPLSAAWPGIEGQEWTDFVENIRQRGVETPIVLYQGKVLEGWHRYQASTNAYVECQCLDFDGTPEEAASLVRSHNHHRRHITLDERLQARIRMDRWVAAQAGTEAYRSARGDHFESHSDQLDLNETSTTIQEDTPSVGEYQSKVAGDEGTSAVSVARARRKVEQIDEEMAERIDRCMQASSHQGDDHRREMEQRAQQVQTGEMAPDEFLRIYEEPDSQVATPPRVSLPALPLPARRPTRIGSRSGTPTLNGYRTPCQLWSTS